jgi:hypothetical protein
VVLNDFKSWVRGKLIASTALTALVPAGQILSAWPNVFTTLPMLTLLEAGQSNGQFADNQPFGNDSVLEFHVFTAYTDSTLPISQELDKVLTSLRYTLAMTMEVPEPQQKVRHRVLRFSRESVNLDAMQ